MPMTCVRLDPKKLLGFKLIAQAPTASAAAIAGKVGGKAMTQLGAKVGAKFGVKTLRPAARG